MQSFDSFRNKTWHKTLSCNKRTDKKYHLLSYFTVRRWKHLHSFCSGKHVTGICNKKWKKTKVIQFQKLFRIPVFRKKSLLRLTTPEMVETFQILNLVNLWPFLAVQGKCYKYRRRKVEKGNAHSVRKAFNIFQNTCLVTLSKMEKKM